MWDLRQRKQYASIPAHSNLITQIKFANSFGPQNGEFLTSSSFDGTGKGKSFSCFHIFYVAHVDSSDDDIASKNFPISL